MKRAAFASPSPVDDDGKRRFSTLKPTTKAMSRESSLERKPLKRKARRAKPGDDAARKAFVKRFVCVVGGRKCGPSDPHHEIDGHGENRKGMGQTAPDARTFPLCRKHHEDFHNGRGFCRGWSKQQRRYWQDQEIARFDKIWSEYQETGVLVEPLQAAI